jgi:hypothetical protein
MDADRSGVHHIADIADIRPEPLPSSPSGDQLRGVLTLSASSSWLFPWLSSRSHDRAPRPFFRAAKSVAVGRVNTGLAGGVGPLGMGGVGGRGGSSGVLSPAWDSGLAMVTPTNPLAPWTLNQSYGQLHSTIESQRSYPPRQLAIQMAKTDNHLPLAYR